MTLNSKPNSASIISEPDTEVSLVFAVTGLSAISLVLESICGNFNNQLYIVYISDDGVDFIKLREVLTGYDSVVSNSWTYKNQLYHGSPLYYKFMIVFVPKLGDNIRCRVLISAK